MIYTNHTNLPQAACDVLAERHRQVEAEGWTPAHDDQHADGSLCMAAICYAEWDHYEHPSHAPQDELVPINWPWAIAWWKPRDRRRNLVKSAALILAEIERLDREAERVAEGEHSAPECLIVMIGTHVAGETEPAQSDNAAA